MSDPLQKDVFFRVYLTNMYTPAHTFWGKPILTPVYMSDLSKGQVSESRRSESVPLTQICCRFVLWCMLPLDKQSDSGHSHLV